MNELRNALTLREIRVLHVLLFPMMFSFALTNVSQGKFPIGAIFDWEDVYTKTGFNYAMAKFNENRPKEFGMTSFIEEIDINNSFQLVQKICQHMSNGVFVLLGTSAFASRDVIDSFSEKFHMPYLSTSIMQYSPRSSSYFPEQGYQIKMRPDLTQALFALIDHFRWTEIYYLYDSDEGLLRLQELTKLFNGASIKIQRSRRLRDVDNAYEELRLIDNSDFTTQDNTRNILIDLSSERAYLRLFDQIREVGMNKEGYSYLVASLDMLNLNMDRFIHGGVNITGFQLVDHSEPYVKDFIQGWTSLPPRIWPGAGDTIKVDAALAYDVVTLLNETFASILANNSEVFRATFRRAEIYNFNLTKGVPCKDKIPWMHGKRLMSTMRQGKEGAKIDSFLNNFQRNRHMYQKISTICPTDFVQIDTRGLTGRILFDSYGRRRDITLHVYKVQLNFGPAKIGEWTAKHGYVPNGVNVTKKEKTNGNEVKPYIYTVTSIFEKPFLQYKSDHYDRTGNDRFEGYAVDLVKAVAERNNFKYVIKPIEDKIYGTLLQNGSWNGMIGKLINKEADLAVAPLTITMERERVVDFSKPFMNSGISIMIKTPEVQKPGVFSFMKPFSLPLWMCLVIGYIVVSFGMFVVSRFSPAEWNRKILRMDKGNVNKFTLQSSLWFTMGALMMQGSDTCPRSAAGRIIGGTWWLVVLIAISSYTANLAAFLTIDKLLTPIEGADDLAGQTEIAYGILDSGSTLEFFKKSNVSTWRTMWQYMSSNPQVFVKTTEDGIRRVRESKGKYAFLLESVYNEYFNQKEPCNTMQVGPPLSTKGYGIATPKNSSLRDDISITVLQLIEDGSLIKMKKTWWVDKGECGVQGQQQGSKKKSLSLSNIAGGFFILISGLVLAIIVAVVEFQRSKSRGKREGFFLLGSDLTQPLMYSYVDNPYENGQNPLNHFQPSPRSPPKGILTSGGASSSEKQQNDCNDKINGQFSANH